MGPPAERIEGLEDLRGWSPGIAGPQGHARIQGREGNRLVTGKKLSCHERILAARCGWRRAGPARSPVSQVRITREMIPTIQGMKYTMLAR